MAVRIETELAPKNARRLGNRIVSLTSNEATDTEGLGRWTGKRTFDIVVAFALLLASGPLLLIVSLAVKLSSPGPVFFRHTRVGFGGREFPMLKFRTMRVGSETFLNADEGLLALYVAGDHKIPHRMDPRVTRLGRFLRRTSLDELPQLFNVLKGEMSLVGPRPVERAQLPQYAERQNIYLAMRPGLVGLWQVKGRSTIKFPRRAELDEHYFRGSSIGFDLRILLRAPLAVVRGMSAD